MSLETKEPNKKERLEDIATSFYLNAFRFFIVLLTIIVFVIVFSQIIVSIPRYATIFLLCTPFISFYYILWIKRKAFERIAISSHIRLSALSIRLFKRDFLKPLLKRLFIKCSKLNKFMLYKWSELRKIPVTYQLIVSPVFLFLVVFTLLFVFLLILVVPLIVVYILYIMDSSSSLLIIVVLALPIYALTIFITEIEGFKKIDLSEVFEVTPVIIYLGVVITLILMPNFFTGHLAVDMNSIYYKQDKQIPIDISITGFRDNSDEVFLKLYRSGSEVPLDSINIRLNFITTEKILGENNNTYLCGNSLGLGRYKVFINSSSLTEGDYDLSITCGKYSHGLSNYFWENIINDLDKNESMNNSFYLVDAKKT